MENASDERIGRRTAIVAGVGMLAGMALPGLAGEQHGKVNPDEGVTAPEDLMKEHGVLNRCLLIYEEGMRRLRANEEVPPNVFHHTATLVQGFVENYHERNEEKYIFPLFKGRGELANLVHTRLAQHRAGRVVTNRILHLSTPDEYRSGENRDALVASILEFIRMYRPHEAREDTVLFPAVRTVLTPKQVSDLGDKMEEDEHKVLGHEGFERSVAEVAAIERALGIYDLNQFTPHT